MRNRISTKTTPALLLACSVAMSSSSALGEDAFNLVLDAHLNSTTWEGDNGAGGGEDFDANSLNRYTLSRWPSQYAIS